jgi:hypothetical protein
MCWRYVFSGNGETDHSSELPLKKFYFENRGKEQLPRGVHYKIFLFYFCCVIKEPKMKNFSSWKETHF